MKSRIALALAALLFASSAAAQSDPAREEAKTRFERGLALYQKKSLDAALAEFVQSLALYPTRAAAFNAARVYKELHRYDEALDVLASVPKRFPDLSGGDRAELDREMRELETNVGTIAVDASEPDSSIAIDGRERIPTTEHTYSISTGTHVVRVVKAGFIPFEQRVDVPSQATVHVAAKLGALTRGGRLTVTEDRGEKIVVLVDGIEVGKTPWEGTVAVGKHVVTLRGEERVGSPPTPVDIKLNQLSKLSLVAEPLECSLRVEPTPRTAHVAVDGVDLGSGVWQGPLRCGGHQVELGAEGFVARTKAVTLAPGPALLVTETLERDASSAVWQAQNPPKIFFEANGAVLLTPGYGGELGSFGFGGALTVRAGYRLGLGLGFSIDAGALAGTEKTAGRATETLPYGLPAHKGVADDRSNLSGPMLGASVSYLFGPIAARLGGGILFGTLTDRRSGTFTTPSNASYVLPEVEQSPALTALYVDPEVRYGFEVFHGGTLEVGIRGLAIAPLGGAKRWSDSTELSLGACPNPDRTVCSGRGVYASQDLTSGLFFFFGPTFGLRVEL